MKAIILVLFTFVVFTLQRPVDEGPNAKILKYENVLEPNGEYQFEFESSDGTKRQEKAVLKKAPDGTDILAVQGSYSYYDPNGVLYNVYYVADDTGYHIAPVVTPALVGRPARTRIDPSALASLAGSGI